MNHDTLTGRWPQLKDQVRQRWSKLTADDFTHLNGTTADLVGVLRRRYGYGQVQAALEIDQWLLSQTPTG